MMNARYVISNMLQFTGVNAAALARRRDSLTVLCYHRVLDADDPARPRTHPAMVTSKHVFEQQMEIISREFRPVTLSEAIDWLNGGGQIPQRAVIVTFDDGWADTCTSAFPVMKRLGVPGVVFLATGLIGTSDRQWADAAYESIAAHADSDVASREVERLKAMPSRARPALFRDFESAQRLPHALAWGRSDQPTAAHSPNPETAIPRLYDSPNLTWPQVEEMAAHGFEFGSHTRSHLILPGEPEEEVMSELRGAADDIAAHLGAAPKSFAYPDGQFDERAADLVKNAGYQVALTADEGLVLQQIPRFALPRLSIHDGVCATPRGDFSRAMFVTYLAGTIPWRYRRRVR